jgi:hypothetical protein
MPLLQAMQFIMIHGGNMKLEDVKTYDLIDELEARGYTVRETDDGVSHGDTDSIVDKIFHARRQGKPYDHLLDQFLYEQTGRAI